MQRPNEELTFSECKKWLERRANKIFIAGTRDAREMERRRDIVTLHLLEHLDEPIPKMPRIGYRMTAAIRRRRNDRPDRHPKRSTLLHV